MAEKSKRDSSKPTRQRKPISVQRLVLIVVFTIYIIMQVCIAFQKVKPATGEIGYTELFQMIENEEVDEIAITKEQDYMIVYTKDGEAYDCVNPQSDAFIEELMEAGADIAIQKQSTADAISAILLTLPFVAILALIAIYLSSTIIGGSTKMFTLIKPNQNNTTFDSIKGLGETKKEVKFAVDQLKNWKSLDEIGARPCKGLLLYGPPGTGKTLIARAIANEANVPFISTSGADFSEMFVGVGAARVRSLWNLAMHNSPCIIFIDEIDCMGKRRKGGDAASNDHNQTLNCLLQRMDGLSKVNGVMVIAATNKREELDEALLRPGRFDRHYYIGPPNCRADRDEMVEYYMENKQFESDDITVEKVSKLMAGLTGAEIEEAMNESVYISLREGRGGKLSLKDIDEAVMKLHTSGVKQDHSSERDTQITAVHEAGHALISILNGLKLAKVSIAPYSGGVGGVTMRDLDVEIDQKLRLKSDLDKDIEVYLAGMLAEEVKFGEHTQGCSNDLEQATKAIYNMVTAYGLGSRVFNENVLMENGISHLLEAEVVKECDDTLRDYREKTREKLENNKEALFEIADLLEKETTVFGDAIEKIVNEYTNI
jgi:cell division protease FtsH